MIAFENNFSWNSVTAYLYILPVPNVAVRGFCDKIFCFIDVSCLGYDDISK